MGFVRGKSWNPRSAVTWPAGTKLPRCVFGELILYVPPDVRAAWRTTRTCWGMFGSAGSPPASPWTRTRWPRGRPSPTTYVHWIWVFSWICEENACLWEYEMSQEPVQFLLHFQGFPGSYVSFRLHNLLVDLFHQMQNVGFWLLSVFLHPVVIPTFCFCSCCSREWATWHWLQTRWRNTFSKRWRPMMWRRCGLSMKGRRWNGKKGLLSQLVFPVPPAEKTYLVVWVCWPQVIFCFVHCCVQCF